MANQTNLVSANDKIMYLIAYLFPILSAIFVYVEYANKQKSLRFHSIQAIIYWITIIIVYYILSTIAIVFSFYTALGLLSLLWIFAWLFGMYIGFQALKGVNVEIPIISDISRSI